jgi:hypothetical protein
MGHRPGKVREREKEKVRDRSRGVRGVFWFGSSAKGKKGTKFTARIRAKGEKHILGKASCRQDHYVLPTCPPQSSFLGLLPPCYHQTVSFRLFFTSEAPVHHSSFLLTPFLLASISTFVLFALDFGEKEPLLFSLLDFQSSVRSDARIGYPGHSHNSPFWPMVPTLLDVIGRR